MKRKAHGAGSDDQWQAAAKQQIEGNNTTALTTSDDHYTGIEGGAKFDEIHELIHICSAQGGESPQYNWCLKFNEMKEQSTTSRNWLLQSWERRL